MIDAARPLPPLATEAREAGPIGLLVVILLCIAVAFLARSMITHVNRVPRSFDRPDDGPRTDDPPAIDADPAEGPIGGPNGGPTRSPPDR